MYSAKVRNISFDKSLFVQKRCLRTNYIESNIEEDIDLKNHYKIRILSSPQEYSDAVCKPYSDSGLNVLSILRNTRHVDFNDKSLDNVRFVQVKSYRLSENILH